LGRCATPPDTLPPWPTISDAEIDDILDQVKVRAETLFPLFQNGLHGRIAQAGAWLVWTVGVKRYLLYYAQWKIKSDLIARAQHSGYPFVSIAERRVMGLISDPAYDFYTAAYIADTLTLDTNTVASILAAQTKTGKASYDKGSDGWTLTARKPGWLQSFGDWITIGKPTVAKLNKDAVAQG
jgi:hypothetical protein